jgi:hypothetical protein
MTNPPHESGQAACTPRTSMSANVIDLRTCATTVTLAAANWAANDVVNSTSLPAGSVVCCKTTGDHIFVAGQLYLRAIRETTYLCTASDSGRGASRRLEQR